MKKSTRLMNLIGLFALLLGLASYMIVPATAAPQLQLTPFPTPTPGPDGRIIYIVQSGDTLWRVSAISGVSIDEIRALNNLGADDVLTEGQSLLLGLAGPPVFSPTPGPTPTPSPEQPTPTPEMGSAMLCILLFDDQNGDALRQEEELSIPGGAISITNRDGDFSLTEETQPGAEPDCFEEIPEGEYNITVAAPEEYNPTTIMNYALSVEAGDETYLDFGAQLNSQALAQEVTTAPIESQNTSTLFGWIGGILVLVGIGLGVYAFRLRK